jgi:hypothetical protein
MENLDEFNDDRREFFRINDQVYLDLKPIDSSDVEHFIGQAKQIVENDTVKQRQQLTSLQNAFALVVDQINQTDREVARALRLLNDKVELLSRMVNRLDSCGEECPLVEVNLSGGGFSYMSEKEFNRKQAFEFKMELRPSGAIIQGVASVVGCSQPFDAPKDTPHMLRLVFSYMTEHDRNQLVKHTLARQAEILRASKNQA